MLSTKFTMSPTSFHQPYTHKNSTVHEVNKVNHISHNQCQSYNHTVYTYIYTCIQWQPHPCTYVNIYIFKNFTPKKVSSPMESQPIQPYHTHHLCHLRTYEKQHSSWSQQSQPNFTLPVSATYLCTYRYIHVFKNFIPGKVS